MPQLNITTTAQYSLQNVSLGQTGIIAFQIISSGATYSIVPRERVQRVPNAAPYYGAPYVKKDSTTVASPGTAITADGVYVMDASGMESILDATVTSAGTGINVYYWALEGAGGVSTGSGGGGGGGGAVTVADGADVAQGATTDTAVIGDNPGTQNQHLRGLTSVLTGTVYNSTDNLLRMELVKDSTPIPTTALPVVVQDSTLTYTMPTGDNAARAINTKVTDGTNTATVKAASIAPLATDTALVVAISPNTPITSTGNVQGVVSSGTAAGTTKPILIGAVDQTVTNPNLVNVASATVTQIATGNSFSNSPNLLLVGAVPMTYTGATYIRTNAIGSSAIGDNNGGTTIPAVGNYLTNGTTYDQQRNNTAVSAFASASRTTTQTSADIVNYNGRGLHVILDDTVPGTGSVTLTINGKDPASGKYYTLLAGSAVTTTTTNIYRIYPGLTAVANSTASDVLPRIFQLVITANNANAVTYSVGYSIIL